MRQLEPDHPPHSLRTHSTGPCCHGDQVKPGRADPSGSELTLCIQKLTTFVCRPRQFLAQGSKAGSTSEFQCLCVCGGAAPPQPKTGSNPRRTEDIMSITRVGSCINHVICVQGSEDMCVCVVSCGDPATLFYEDFTDSALDTLPTQVIQNFKDVSSHNNMTTSGLPGRRKQFCLLPGD